jgi:hypothetical protein
VHFDPRPKSVMFHQNLPPSSLGSFLVDVGRRFVSLKSCLKSKSGNPSRGKDSGQCASATGSYTNLEPLPHDAVRCGYSTRCAAQEKKDENGWQLVRSHKWWRKIRKLHVKSISSDLQLKRKSFFRTTFRVDASIVLLQIISALAAENLLSVGDVKKQVTPLSPAL